MALPADQSKREQERILLLLIEEVSKGLADVAQGKTQDALSVLKAIQRRRAAQSH